MLRLQRYSNNFLIFFDKLIKQIPQWSHLADEMCSRSLMATYSLIRPLKLMH